MLVFIYRNAAGEVSERRLETWNENSVYLQGYCRLSGMPKTYRKDRVIEYLEGEDLLLGDKAPFVPEPDSSAARSPTDTRPQILFTGFKAADREALELFAEESGLRVVKTATKKLSFLCAGDSAGPVKTKKAHEAKAFILTRSELEAMLETGEVPC